MKQIRSNNVEFNPKDLTLKEPCEAWRLEGWTLWHGLACDRPSRRARERAPLDEVTDGIDTIRTSETVY
jgi:hypothetical protein